MRLSECKPLKFVVPGPDNIRRRNLETYFQSHGVEVEAMLEMDAMIATLEFVARSDWVTILPSVISVNDIGRGELIVNPIVAPELHAEFVVIQPTRRTLTDAGAPVPRNASKPKSRIFTKCGTRRSRGRDRKNCARDCVVMPGFMPGIHAILYSKAWMRRRMSAFGGKADIAIRRRYVR